MRNERAGLTLIEVLIASVVLSVGILGLVSAITSATIVDTVAQEHRVALDAAREVIERIKSEGAAALFERIDESAAEYSATEPSTEPQQTAQTTDEPSNGNRSNAVTALGAEAVQGTNNGGGNGQGQSHAEGSGGVRGQGQEPVVAANASAAKDDGEVPVGVAAGVSDAEGPGVGGGETAALGLSWFGTPLGEGCGIVDIDPAGNFTVRGLEPCADDPDGKVGKVVVTKYAPDVVEITVTVRWYGSRGQGQQVLRCRITDWQGQDGR
ncbi:MAG: prepilin-type N-terminal cleavage/methylation domain-containing protein [Planctomycetes bacterium]|nr:prepilin-type N-terminal cleavage/methylation domain-containing protein [Planctomycetota bacterium]